MLFFFHIANEVHVFERLRNLTYVRKQTLYATKLVRNLWWSTCLCT